MAYIFLNQLYFQETNAIHINVGPGSYMEITLPWLVAHDGYTTKITGQLLHLEATTSLQVKYLFFFVSNLYYLYNIIIFKVSQFIRV